MRCRELSGKWEDEEHLVGVGVENNDKRQTRRDSDLTCMHKSGCLTGFEVAWERMARSNETWLARWR